MAGPRTIAFGKFLSTFGGLWMLAALLTAFLAPRGAAVPFLPGLLIYLAGKALSAIGKRDTIEESEDSGAESPTTIEPEPLARPAQERPVTRRNEYLDERTKPTPDPGFEVPDLEEAILEPPPPMTSEEMVAEARRQFAPRPFEEGR